MIRITFDTSILVDDARNYQPAVRLVEKVARKEIERYMSGITEADILSGKDCKKQDAFKKTLDLLSLFTKAEVENQILQKAAEYRRSCDVKLLDAVSCNCLPRKMQIMDQKQERFRNNQRNRSGRALLKTPSSLPPQN